MLGYDKAAQLVHHAHKNDLSLKAAALELELMTESEFDQHIDLSKMLGPTASD